jgi:hypothetical protein
MRKSRQIKNAPGWKSGVGKKKKEEEVCIFFLFFFKLLLLAAIFMALCTMCLVERENWIDRRIV